MEPGVTDGETEAGSSFLSRSGELLGFQEVWLEGNQGPGLTAWRFPGNNWVGELAEPDFCAGGFSRPLQWGTWEPSPSASTRSVLGILTIFKQLHRQGWFWLCLVPSTFL